MYCYYKCSVALPHGAVGWSAVCDFGISWSYSLVDQEMIHLYHSQSLWTQNIKGLQYILYLPCSLPPTYRSTGIYLLAFSGSQGNEVFLESKYRRKYQDESRKVSMVSVSLVASPPHLAKYKIFIPLCTSGVFLLVCNNKLGMVHFIYWGGTIKNFPMIFVHLSLNFSVLKLANSVDPDEMPHYAAFHLGLHCVPRAHLRVTSIHF